MSVEFAMQVVKLIAKRRLAYSVSKNFDNFKKCHKAEESNLYALLCVP